MEKNQTPTDPNLNFESYKLCFQENPLGLCLNMKIAILQNKVNIGGRSKVISEVIRVFNEFGIMPDLISFSTSKEISLFKFHYAKDGEILFKTIQPIKLYLKRGTSFQLPLLNLISRKLLLKYNIIFNSNNCCYLLPSGPKYIHYIHHPPEAELAYKERYNSSIKWRAYVFPLKLFYSFLSIDINNSIFIANSEFTRDKILEFYPLKKNDIGVIYPPTISSIKKVKKNKEINRVVSLGAFFPDKKQIDQLYISKSFPNLEFNIIGQIKSYKYYNECYKFIEKYKLHNVQLLPNSESTKVRSELECADIFLHTRINEHFGISIVESISYGCIPVVHNSGGQKEIVPNEELRFNTIDDAITKINWIMNLTNKAREEIRAELKVNISKFLTLNFRKQIKAVYNELNFYSK